MAVALPVRRSRRSSANARLDVMSNPSPTNDTGLALAPGEGDHDHNCLGKRHYSPETFSATRYNMNKQKVAQQKILATDRPSLVMTDTGGGIKICLNAAVYELFKDCLATYFESPSADFVMSINKRGTIKTKDGLEERRALNILPSSGTTAEKNKEKFTVNLYHTTCTVLITGRGSRNFLKHYDTFSTQLDKLPPGTLKMLNHQIRDSFNNVQNPKCTKQTIAHDCLELDSTARPTYDLDEDESAQCPTCSRDVSEKHDALVCDICNFWMLIRCIGISYADYQMHTENETRPFTCPSCKSLRDTPTIMPSTTNSVLPSIMTPPVRTLSLHDTAVATIPSTTNSAITAVTTIPSTTTSAITAIAVIPSTTTSAITSTVVSTSRPITSISQHLNGRPITHLPLVPAQQTRAPIEGRITTAAETPDPQIAANERKVRQLEKKLAGMKLSKEHAEGQIATNKAYIATLENLLTQKDNSSRLQKQCIAKLEEEIGNLRHAQPTAGASSYPHHPNTFQQPNVQPQPNFQSHQIAMATISMQCDIAQTQRDAAMFQMQLQRETMAFANLQMNSKQQYNPPRHSQVPADHPQQPHGCQRKQRYKPPRHNHVSPGNLQEPHTCQRTQHHTHESPDNVRELNSSPPPSRAPSTGDHTQGQSPDWRRELLVDLPTCQQRRDDDVDAHSQEQPFLDQNRPQTTRFYNDSHS